MVVVDHGVGDPAPACSCSVERWRGVLCQGVTQNDTFGHITDQLGGMHPCMHVRPGGYECQYERRRRVGSPGSACFQACGGGRRHSYAAAAAASGLCIWRRPAGRVRRATAGRLGRYPCPRSDSGCKSRLGPSWRVWGRVWPGVWPVVGLLSGWAGPGWPVGWSVSGWPMLANLNQGVDHVGGRVAKCPTFAPACPCYQGRVSHCSRHC